MKKSAFTLIELLVVISIIAILASIAVPVFGKAIEKSKATSCAANLRQLGMGTVSYLNDNEDQMFGSGTGAAWPVTLQTKYVQNWKTFKSPFDNRPDRSGNDAPVSYGINRNVAGVHASKYAAPSQLILYAPSLGSGKEVSFSGTGNSNPTVSPGNGPRTGTHSNRTQINVCYADAHAGSISAAEFSESSNVDGRKRWYPEDPDSQ
jgi:prepilin-type N-terminal cleavage/methylation domain-containing protein/prepilin-type processing-associated H-X9-DG protein